MIKLLISREVDYALRILRDLSDGELHAVKELCGREFIPYPFAYKIIRKLSASGLISTARGVGGGIRLSGDLREHTLYDLLEIMEPGRHISACTKPDYRCEWRGADRRRCCMHLHLLEIERRIHEELRRKSLHALLLEGESHS